jgi:hypothetical protein
MSKSELIQIPHGFKPRVYQLPIMKAFDGGCQRGVWVVHRRAGKDKTCWNILIKKAFERIGVYFYILPLLTQARKIIFDGIDKSGFPFLAHVPPSTISSKNTTEMKIKLKTGSVIQVIGSDNIDAIVGTNPVGLVYSEYALQKTEAWDFIRPIVRENDGWVLFQSTPRGRNHFFEMYRTAMSDPLWFCEKLDVTNTVDDDGNPVISDADIEQERNEGMSEALIQQEYYCSFDISSDDILIPLQVIEPAVGRNISYRDMPSVAGLDVGMSLGGDPSALVVRQGTTVTFAEEWRMDDTVRIAAHVKDRWNEGKFGIVAVDAIGWGAGVAHLLREWGVPTVAVNVAESAASSERFARLRDELWWRCREWFDKKECAIKKDIENANKLVVELSTPTYTTNLSGKIKIESKDDMKKRGVKSPNLADAFVLSFHASAQGPINRQRFKRKRLVT